MNFKEMYKAANENIHAPSGALEKVFEAPKKERSNRQVVKFCAAIAAAAAVAVSSVYLSGQDINSEPVKLIQAEPKAEKEDNTASRSVVSNQNEASENANNTEIAVQTDTAEKEVPSVSASPAPTAEKAVQNTESAGSSSAISETSENSVSVKETVQEATPTGKSALSEAFSEDSAEALSETAEITEASNSDAAAYAYPSAVSEATNSEASYEEYCKIVGYDVISKANLPDGVSIEKPQSLFIDGNQNPNTFYTTSDSSKECYITVSVTADFESANASAVEKHGDTFEIKANVGAISLFAECCGFSEDEAKQLANSLID